MISQRDFHRVSSPRCSSESATLILDGRLASHPSGASVRAAVLFAELWHGAKCSSQPVVRPSLRSQTPQRSLLSGWELIDLKCEWWTCARGKTLTTTWDTSRCEKHFCWPQPLGVAALANSDTVSCQDAENVPLTNFSSSLKTWDKTQPVVRPKPLIDVGHRPCHSRVLISVRLLWQVFVCKMGIRSGRVAVELEKTYNFTKVACLKGGLLTWKEAHLPLIRD